MSYSDSEKESRKSKDVSGDKRKHKYYDSVNGDYYEEYTSSSKRRKGKLGDSGNERWNGKDEDKDKGESSKKTKTSSRRREELDAYDTKKTTAKSDANHRDPSRRETKEPDKERKHKESKTDKFYDADDHHKSKPLTESKAQDHVRSPGTENYTEKRSRRKRDDHATGDKHQDYSDDVADRLQGCSYLKQYHSTNSQRNC